MASDPAIPNMSVTLDIGCGRNKHNGAIGLDLVRLTGVDIVSDIEKCCLPFEDNRFQKVYIHHVLEHIRDLTGALDEIERVCATGAIIEILVPYFTCVGAFGDPTHVRFFTYHTFDYFTDDEKRYIWFSDTRFTIKSRYIGFGHVFRTIGVEWFANRFPGIYENFFAYICPGRTLKVELVVA
ncbi:MAG: class I SAM-dependent methyltransferase [Chloroflexales bacterium]|nr:class I SAM-dependent methyltransferase [Chloroflexales bacterium]